MGIVKWLKEKYEKQKPSYKCPICGSTNLASFSVITNFVQVVRDQKAPDYVDTYKCGDCGYITDKIEELL